MLKKTVIAVLALIGVGVVATYLADKYYFNK